MSKKEKVTEQQTEKVMTKYDLKMQKRQEAKEKAKRAKRREKVTWAVVIIALVCIVASFPIRTAIAVNKTFVRINGEAITKVEFDYNYNVVKNNYINSMGSYLSMFGMDLSGDLSTQMYSQDMTWEEYFEYETVQSIIQNKALKKEAEAAGFTYDTEGEYASFKEGIQEAATATGLATGDYVKQVYGSYATMGRIKDFVKESIYVSGYYMQLSEEKAPSDEEILAYYEADKSAFDSVDYYMTLIKAELPTEPTDLADTTEEAEGTATEETYQPSEAEIEKAMADAKVLADAAVDTVTTDGELREGAQYASTSSLLRDWLFEDSRKEGDTTVVEDTSGNQYYVLSFVKRYLDETPSADVRIIMTEGGAAQSILDEWKSGDATEDSFAALADKYNDEASYSAEGGLYEGITPSGIPEVIADWLMEANRTAGDTAALDEEDGTAGYVLYYVGENAPEWKLNAKTEILTDTMESYLQEISKDAQVDDVNGNLEYIEIMAAEEAAAAESAAAETEATGEE